MISAETMSKFFGAPCTKKFGLSLKKNKNPRSCLEPLNSLRKVFGEDRQGRQKFLPQTPSFLPAPRIFPPFLVRNN
jgi:hypothetical protein